MIGILLTTAQPRDLHPSLATWLAGGSAILGLEKGIQWTESLISGPCRPMRLGRSSSPALTICGAWRQR